MDTLWHTSNKRAAVKSLISSCLIDGYPPLGHDSTCSTESGCHKHNLVEHSQDSRYNVKPKHHERLAQSHILQVVELKARWRHLFLGERSMVCAGECGRISFRVEAVFESFLVWI